LYLTKSSQNLPNDMVSIFSTAPVASSRDLQLQIATEQDAGQWDQLVMQHAEGRFAHLWAFRFALESAYGYRCVYLKMVLDDRLVGVFPSVLVNNRVPRLVSQPFTEYGGPLVIEPTLKPRCVVAELLHRAAVQLCCRSVEIRGGVGAEFLTSSQYCTKYPLFSYAELNLTDQDTLWRRSLTRIARQCVYKATKAGLRGEMRRGGAAVAAPFYDLYLLSMKRLGVPPHSRQFFTKLATGLGDLLVSTWIFQGDRIGAILLGGICGQRLEIFSIVSDPEFWATRANDLAHWHLISWAVGQGLRRLDFGSARYKGQIQFKKKWGVQLYDYDYYILGEPATLARDTTQIRKTPARSMQTMSHVWAKVMPLALTRIVGPPIRKYRTK
jgi:hypothetical protein